MARKLIGGNFAPPLTDELLADYRKRVDGMKPSPEKDAIGELLTCCETWWNLPEPAGTATVAHPVGRGLIVDMQEDHKQALWDLIPWEHELDAMGGGKGGQAGMFDAIEADVAGRNGERLAAWQRACEDALYPTFFPDFTREEFKQYRYAQRLLHRDGDEAIPLLAAAGLTVDAISQFAEKVAAWQVACNDVVQPGETPPVPKPEIEPTPIRNMAFHLLWHVRELNLDREPMTSDKI